MARQTQNPFPSWGETGKSPDSGTDYQGGDNPKADSYDYLWNELNKQFSNIITDFNNIDSDGDGVVDEADAAQSASTDFDLSGFKLTDSTRGYLDFTGNDVRVGTGASIEDSNANRRISMTSSNTWLYGTDDSPMVRMSNSTVDLAVGNKPNLRIATDQSIEDSDGTTRFNIQSSRTRMHFDNGDTAVSAKSGGFLSINAYDGVGVDIFDNNQSAVGVSYDTDPSGGADVGLFRTPNAGVSVEATQFPNSGASVQIAYDNAGTESFDGLVQAYDWTNDVFKELAYKASLHDFSQNSANLRIGTGQSIEDEGGTDRVIIDSSGTFIRDETGVGALNADADANGGYVTKYSTGGKLLRDNEGGFDAINYDADSTLGTLELTNADLTLKGGTRPLESNNGSGAGIAIDNTAADFDISSRLVFISNNGDEAFLKVNNGDLQYTDPSGNTTTIA